MPVIKTGYGWGLWGLGEGEQPAVTAIAPSTAPTAPVQAQFGFVDGLKVWTNPSQILPAFGNLGSMFSVAPWAAVGFLAPVAVVGFLLLGGAGGAGYVVGRRKARRAANPQRKRRRAGRRRNSATGSYFIDSVDGEQMGMPQRMPKSYALAMTRRAADHYGKSMQLWGYGRDGKAKLITTVKPGGAGSRRRNPRGRNGRSYAVRGHRVPPSYVPGPSKVFYLSGRKGRVKSVVGDWVQFQRPVDGTTGMSLGNFRQAAYIE